MFPALCVFYGFSCVSVYFFRPRFYAHESAIWRRPLLNEY